MFVHVIIKQTGCPFSLPIAFLSRKQRSYSIFILKRPFNAQLTETYRLTDPLVAGIRAGEDQGRVRGILGPHVLFMEGCGGTAWSLPQRGETVDGLRYICSPLLPFPVSTWLNTSGTITASHPEGKCSSSHSKKPPA